MGHYSLRKTWILECIAGLVSEHPSVVNVLMNPTHCRTLQQRTFLLHFHHSDKEKAVEQGFKMQQNSDKKFFAFKINATELAAVNSYYCDENTWQRQMMG